jgi:hypothetical protein
MRKETIARMVGSLRIVVFAAMGMLMFCGGAYRASPAHGAHSSGPQAPSQVDISGWKTYRSDAHGFELKYPAAWSVHEGSGTMESVLICKTPYADGSTGLQFAVQRQANPDSLSIEAWTADELAKMKQASVSQIPITLGGRPAIRIQVGTTYEIAARWNGTGILNIFYHSAQPEPDANYSAMLSTFKFL